MRRVLTGRQVVTTAGGLGGDCEERILEPRPSPVHQQQQARWLNQHHGQRQVLMLLSICNHVFRGRNCACRRRCIIFGDVISQHTHVQNSWSSADVLVRLNSLLFLSGKPQSCGSNKQTGGAQICKFWSGKTLNKNDEKMRKKHQQPTTKDI